MQKLHGARAVLYKLVEAIFIYFQIESTIFHSD